jgi:hypothetical protein
MADKVKALIIDPFLQNIYEKMFKKGDIKQIQEAVGGNYFTSAGTFDNFDVLFVDDEGLFKDNQKFFTLKELNSQPLAGVGVVMGGNSETGDTEDVKINEVDLALKVEWLGELKQ